MANSSLQANLAQENARRIVTDTLVPRQNYWRDQLGIDTEPQSPTPFPTFDGPMVTPQFMSETGYGGAPSVSGTGTSVSSPSPSSTSGPTIGFANAFTNAVDAYPGLLAAPLGIPTLGIIALTNMNNPASEDPSNVNAVNGLDAASDAAVGPGPDSATDASSVGAVNGADAASDGASGGGAGGGSKIVCTAMNQAYGFGSFRQAIWLDYSAKRLTKQHERGYHRIFRPLVKYAFYSGNGIAKNTIRRFLEWIMRLRTADLRAEMRGNNPHPVQRIVRRTCERICYIVGR